MAFRPTSHGSDSVALFPTNSLQPMRSLPLFGTASLALAMFGATVPVARAQVVSSGLTGVVREQEGKPVAGAAVTAKHLPTGTVFSATTSAEGRYNLRGLIVGGPYAVEVKVAGFKPVEQTVFTTLGGDTDANFRLEGTSEDILTLEALVVEADANELDANARGSGRVLSAAQLAAKPSAQRSIADLVSANPLVTLRALSGDREEAQISAVGQNNRYNSIQIDGARINDQFGLNGTGLASFFNPLSVDTIEQLSVQISPYDVRQSYFTGASINAVTKSGTNEFHGSFYYYFSGDEWMGVKLQGEDVSGGTVGRVPTLDRQTYGLTLGGPILKNKLFFFVNYEKFERVQAPITPGFFFAANDTQLAQIRTRFDQYNSAAGKSIGWGDISSAVNTAEDEKYLAKLDWNINRDHRASFRYSTTEGLVPQFGSLSSTSRTNSSVPTTAGGTLTSSGLTALDGNFYAQERKEKSWSAQLFSQWSPVLKTEARFASTKQDQLTPIDQTAPEVTIWGLTGLNRSGGTINSGALVTGTDQFRQGNAIFVDTKQFSVTGDYFRGDFVWSGGIEREENDFINLFRESSYGLVHFRNLADFLADRPVQITRNFFDPAKRDPADIADFATTGLFGQVRWDVNSRFNAIAGLRYEFNETGKKPAFNQALFDDSGFRNDGTLDGATYLSPRIALNYALDDERTTQLRAGVGHFLGRAPWVFFSNSYNKLGVGDFAVTTNNSTAAPVTGGFTNYLRAFDQENPIATAPDTGAGTREVNFVDPNIKLPSVWRATVGLDRRLSFLASTLSFEVVYTKNEDALFITNENLRPVTLPAADGRQRFAGNPQTAANARFSRFRDLYRISNVDGGHSGYFSAAWSRPLKNRWGFDASLAHGRSKEAQAIGQTTASGQWQRNVIFNQSVEEVGTSDFQTLDRVQLTLTRQFEFIRKSPTTISLYYEGRTGNPFSWIHANDLNGDGQSNDTVAVPTGPDDPRFDFSSLRTLDPQRYQSYFSFLETSGLAKYAGSFAPKNAFFQPWVNRLDLKFVQRIPLRDTIGLELFFDFINFGAFVSKDFFGYYEEANRLTNDVFRRQFVGTAEYGPDGRIRPVQAGATPALRDANIRAFFNPDAFVLDNTQSRWRVQMGARLTF